MRSSRLAACLRCFAACCCRLAACRQRLAVRRRRLAARCRRAAVAYQHAACTPPGAAEHGVYGSPRGAAMHGVARDTMRCARAWCWPVPHAAMSCVVHAVRQNGVAEHGVAAVHHAAQPSMALGSMSRGATKHKCALRTSCGVAEHDVARYATRRSTPRSAAERVVPQRHAAHPSSMLRSTPRGQPSRSWGSTPRGAADHGEVQFATWRS